MSLKIIRKLIKWATQTKVADDAGDYQIVQGKSLGQVPDFRAITSYGLYSSAPIGSEWVTMNVRGNADDKVGIGNDYVNRQRYLKEGETCLFNTLTSARILEQSDGTLDIISVAQIEAKPWIEETEYKVGDKVSTRDGRVFIAILNNKEKYPPLYSLIWAPQTYSRMTLHPNGDITVISEHDTNITVKNDVNVVVEEGDVDIDIQTGSATAFIKSNLTAIVDTGNVDIDINEGDLDVDVKLGDVDLNIAKGSATAFIKQDMIATIDQGDLIVNVNTGGIYVAANDGDVNIYSKTDTNIQVDGDLTADIAGNAIIGVDTQAYVTCPLTTWYGNIVLNGNLTQTGTYTLNGQATATVDFISAGKSGKLHTHGETGGETFPPT